MMLGKSNPEYEKSLRLERKLKLLLGSQEDWLSVYRSWLDENGIPAEVEGWPSAQAYDDHNVNLFVRQQRQSRAA